MAARSAVRRTSFFQRLHPVAIRPEVCYTKKVARMANAARDLFHLFALTVGVIARFIPTKGNSTNSKMQHDVFVPLFFGGRLAADDEGVKEEGNRSTVRRFVGREDDHRLIEAIANWYRSYLDIHF